MIELQVTETVVDLATMDSIRVDVLNTTGIEVQLSVGQVIPAVELDVGIPGPIGVTGPVGPAGPMLQFDTLTELQKQELRGDVGNTSTNYTNIFYDSLLN